MIESTENTPIVQLEFYGSDPRNKPNNHCEWITLTGWFETIEHLRERVSHLPRYRIVGHI